MPITIPFLQSILHPRPVDGHKGTFGHALLVAGSYGMAGAGILAGRGCMRSGVGKLTVHIPQRNNDIMQTALPEAILHHDEDDMRWTSMPVDTAPGTAYNAIGIGPGIHKAGNFGCLAPFPGEHGRLPRSHGARCRCPEHPFPAPRLVGIAATRHHHHATPVGVQETGGGRGMHGQCHPRAQGTPYHHHHP